jgi:hypothetical protein
MANNFATEVMYTPDWPASMSTILGDLKGEIGYITEYGTVHLIGKRDIEVSKNQIESKTDGPTTCITACKSVSVL